MSIFSRLKKRFKRKGRTRSAHFRDYQRNTPQKKRKRGKTLSLKLNNSPKKKRGPLFRWLQLAAVLAAILGLIYWTTLTNSFEIQAIQVEGGLQTEQEQAAIQETLQSQLGKNLLFFVPQEHEDKLHEIYPHLKRVRIWRQFFHTIRVELEPFAELANIQIKDENGNIELKIVNEEGYIAQDGVHSETLPSIVMDITGAETDLESDVVLNKETLARLLQAEELFEAKFGMEVLELEYLKRAREVHLYTEMGFEVWIDLQQDTELQLIKLKKSLTGFDIYSGRIEYVDLRISGQQGEKVIYKETEIETL